jgi:hypothetical protein
MPQQSIFRLCLALYLSGYTTLQPLSAQVERYTLQPMPDSVPAPTVEHSTKAYHGAAFSVRLGAPSVTQTTVGLELEWRTRRYGAVVFSANYFQHNATKNEPNRLKDADLLYEYSDQEITGKYLFTNKALPVEIIYLGEPPRIMPPEIAILSWQAAIGYRFYFEQKRVHKSHYFYIQPSITFGYLDYANIKQTSELLSAQFVTYSGGTSINPILYSSSTRRLKQITRIRRQQLITPGVLYQFGGGWRFRPALILEMGGSLLFNPFTDYDLVERPAPHRFLQVAGVIRLGWAFGAPR